MNRRIINEKRDYPTSFMCLLLPFYVPNITWNGIFILFGFLTFKKDRIQLFGFQAPMDTLNYFSIVQKKEYGCI